MDPASSGPSPADMDKPVADALAADPPEPRPGHPLSLPLRLQFYLSLEDLQAADRVRGHPTLLVSLGWLSHVFTLVASVIFIVTLWLAMSTSVFGGVTSWMHLPVLLTLYGIPLWVLAFQASGHERKSPADPELATQEELTLCLYEGHLLRVARSQGKLSRLRIGWKEMCSLMTGQGVLVMEHCTLGPVVIPQRALAGHAPAELAKLLRPHVRRRLPRSGLAACPQGEPVPAPADALASVVIRLQLSDFDKLASVRPMLRWAWAIGLVSAPWLILGLLTYLTDLPADPWAIALYAGASLALATLAADLVAPLATLALKARLGLAPRVASGMASPHRLSFTPAGLVVDMPGLTSTLAWERFEGWAEAYGMLTLQPHISRAGPFVIPVRALGDQAALWRELLAQRLPQQTPEQIRWS